MQHDAAFHLGLHCLPKYPFRVFSLQRVNSLSANHDCSRRQRGSCMVWEINIGVCPRLDFENIMLFNCLGYNFNIYSAFEFLCNSIANL